jgi:hypothetical protein
MNLFLLILLCIVLIHFLSFKEGMCASACSSCATINVKSLLDGTGNCGKECIDCTDLNIPSYLMDLYNNLYPDPVIINNPDPVIINNPDPVFDPAPIPETGANNGFINRLNNFLNDPSFIFKSLYKCSFKNDKWSQDISGNSLCLVDMSNNFYKYSEPEPIKCIANYGTEIGELANCKSKTIVKSTKYVCPSTMPTCDNFKCGSAFGVCK